MARASGSATLCAALCGAQPWRIGGDGTVDSVSEHERLRLFVLLFCERAAICGCAVLGPARLAEELVYFARTPLHREDKLWPVLDSSHDLLDSTEPQCVRQGRARALPLFRRSSRGRACLWVEL